MRQLIITSVIIFSFLSVHGEKILYGNKTIKSFQEAKKILYSKIYGKIELQKTFYCGCKYNKKRITDLGSCGYKIRKNKKRAKRIEAEHVVPTHAFGQSFPEWRNGHPQCIDSKGKKFKGRKCAEKVNEQYRLMQADLYNLVPSIGEVNGDRSNYSFAEIPGEDRLYGKCDLEILNRKVEPRPEIRGDIARIYFYMEASYPGHGIISNKNKKLFEVWNKLDPVSKEECQRALKIAEIQINYNVFVSNECKHLMK